MTKAPEGASRLQRIYWYLGQVASHIACYFTSKVGNVWRSADGRVRFIEDLDEQHLRNCIAMLERRGANPNKNGRQDKQIAFMYFVFGAREKERALKLPDLEDTFSVDEESPFLEIDTRALVEDLWPERDVEEKFPEVEEKQSVSSSVTEDN